MHNHNQVVHSKFMTNNTVCLIQKPQSFRFHPNCDIIVPTHIWKIIIFNNKGVMDALAVITVNENKIIVSYKFKS